METARPADAPGFSTSRFRAEREADWIAFDTLLGRLETRGAKALSSDELLQLPILYRATLSSLSIARATMLDKALLDHLEGLAMRGYFLIYGVRETRLSRLRRFFLYDWPAAVRAVWKETLIIALIITLGALTSWSLVAHNPEWYYNFVPEEMAGGRDPRATVEFLRSTLGHGKAGGEDQGALHVFATFLFTHNSRVSIMSFALGFAYFKERLQQDQFVEQMKLVEAVYVTNNGDPDGMLGDGLVARLPMPVLLIDGAESPEGSHRIVQALDDLIPDSRLVTIPGAAHMVPITHADSVGPLVAEFLA